MSDNKTVSSGGIGLCGAMFILFLGLRLTGHIDWEWYWVAAPLWMPATAVLAIFALIGTFWLLGAVASKWRRGRSLK